MRNGNSNHKPKRYSLPLPLLVHSDSQILITDGKVQLKHIGDILIRSANTLSVEFEIQESEEQRQGKLFDTTPKTILQLMATSIPNGYTQIMVSKAKTASHGRSKSVYEYYKREKDMSFIAVIRRNGDVRQINLGSLLEPDSVISLALKEFSREKPFYRRDIKPWLLPSGLKQGQRIKACLDILTHEGFLERTEVLIGEKKKTERYVRTSKELP